MLPRSASYGALVALCFTMVLVAAGTRVAAGACTIERSAGATGPFVLHLGADCSESEREAEGLSSATLLNVLAEGRDVDLSGAVLVGPLELDALPVQRLDDVALPAPVRSVLADLAAEQVYTLKGAVTIKNSRVRGPIRSKMNRNLVLAWKPIIVTGTTFEEIMDLSRTVFLGAVDFSSAVFLKEGFFIEARFTQPATFEKTAFGPHTRFHKARFLEPVTFHRAGFNGLSEFIQVSFEMDARFSQAYFKMGTGFSGSRFGGVADFAEATFEREAYFSFAVFQGDAYFRRVTFRSEANFSDAQFHGVDDFSKTWFNVEPSFTRAKISDQAIPKGLQDPRVLYIIAAALLAFSLIFAFILRRG